MNNDITIDPFEISKLLDGSVTDAETIRQIALYTNKTGDLSLSSKVRQGFETDHHIIPDGMTPEQIKKAKDLMSGPYGRPAL